MTPLQLAKAAESIGGDIDQRRFALADLALEARRQKVENWAEVIAQCPSVRRKKRTVEEWAQAAEFRARLSKDYRLPFSFFVLMSRAYDLLPHEVIEDMMTEAESDNATLEQTRALLHDIIRPPGVFSLADFLHVEYERVSKALTKADNGDDIDALRALAEAIDAQRARLIPVREKVE